MTAFFDLLWECAMALVGTVAFALLFSVPRRYYLWCGLIGGAGWAAFKLIDPFWGRTAAIFCAAALVIFLSRLRAVKERCPVTIFMVAGLFPLVPGAGIYWAIYELVMDNPAAASGRGTEALTDAVAIVLGLSSFLSCRRSGLGGWRAKNRRQKDEYCTTFAIRHKISTFRP